MQPVAEACCQLQKARTEFTSAKEQLGAEKCRKSCPFREVNEHACPLATLFGSNKT